VRVLFYYSSPVWTGSARVFQSAARGLADRGYQVTYVCPPGGAVEARVAAEGCEVIPFEPGGPVAIESWRLHHIFLERFVETVFVHSDREHLAAAGAARLAGRGGIIRRTPAGDHLVPDRTTRLASRMASTGLLFTTPTEAQAAPALPRVRGSLVAELGIDPARYDELRPASLMLHNGGPAPRLIVCVYDPGGKQRAATVLRTMGMLAPRHPELHLLLFGPGADHEDLRMQAAALDIGHAVTHLVARDDDLAVLRAADLGWVVASDDTAVYGALDFMAMRVPVLVDRGTVASRYVADGISGIILPPADTPSTAATIAELLAQDEQRAAMGSAGRSRVAREYTERVMVDAIQRAADEARDRSRWK
jgi:glycosyltransferase involved in cell wall biosynthesis